MNIKVKVAVGYARTSAIVNPKASIPNQVLSIKDYCKKNNIFLKEIYIDDCKSGTKVDGRDQYILLKEQVKNQEEIELVIVPFADRLGREAFEFIRTVDELKESRVEVHFIHEGLTSHSASAIQLVMIAIQAELENNQRTKRMVDAKGHLLKKGKYMYGRVPFGYKTDSNKHLVIDEVNSDKVKSIFKWYKDGTSLHHISIKLNEMSNDRKWKGNLIRNLLLNKTYTGYIWDKKGADKGIYRQLSFEPHTPLVSEKDFQECLDRLMEQKFKERVPKFHLLTCGVFLCPMCKKKVVVYYGDKYRCINKCWIEDIEYLDNKVISYFLDIEKSKDDLGSEIEHKEILSNKKHLDFLLAQGLLEINEYKEEMSRIVERLEINQEKDKGIEKVFTPLIQNQNLKQLKRILQNKEVTLSIDSQSQIYVCNEEKLSL